eukprot:11167889-Lingulodinium_polyedra.AAC.1
MPRSGSACGAGPGVPGPLEPPDQMPPARLAARSRGRVDEGREGAVPPGIAVALRAVGERRGLKRVGRPWGFA